MDDLHSGVFNTSVGPRWHDLKWYTLKAHYTTIRSYFAASKSLPVTTPCLGGRTRLSGARCPWENPDAAGSVSQAKFRDSGLLLSGVTPLVPMATASTESICSKCTGIFRSDAWPPRDLFSARHHDNLDDLFKAAKRGCRLCFQLAQILSEDITYQETGRYHRGRLIAKIDGTLADENFGNRSRIQVEFTAISSSSTSAEEHFEWKLSFELVPFRSCKTSLGQLASSRLQQPAREELSRSDDPSVWSQVGNWIRDCAQTHTHCGYCVDDGWLPSRLVDFRGIGETSDGTDMICVRETREYPAHGSYTTLSHCWGGALSLKLTSKSRQLLKSGFPLTNLPNSFADAVWITRRLGCQYIWIDSLCILQDSVEDWKHESANMGKVYQNSYLNIAATGSSNPQGGCFFARQLDEVLPIRIKIPFATDEWKDCLIAQRDIMLESESASLNTRGWVLQERVLSARQLNFGKSQVSWECRERVASESFPGGFGVWGENSQPFIWQKRSVKKLPSLLQQVRNPKKPHHLVRQGGTRFGKLGRRMQELMPQPRDPMLGLYDHWYTLLTRYTRSLLSFKTDRLAAIQGLVEFIKISTGDQFAAGLWLRYIHCDLLWRVEKMTPRQEPLPAPSWSWASCDGAVRLYPPGPFTPDSELVGGLEGAEVIPSTNLDTGIICRGEFSMRSRIYPATLLFDATRGYSWQISGHGEEYEAFLDEDHALAVEEKDLESNSETHAFGALQFLLLVLRENHTFAGLLLEPVGKEPGTLRRIGMCAAKARLEGYKLLRKPWSVEKDITYREAHHDGLFSVMIV